MNIFLNINNLWSRIHLIFAPSKFCHSVFLCLSKENKASTKSKPQAHLFPLCCGLLSRKKVIVTFSTATAAPGSLCRGIEFECASDSSCLPASYQCDGENDCVDSSDERGCCKCSDVIKNLFGYLKRGSSNRSGDWSTTVRLIDENFSR